MVTSRWSGRSCPVGPYRVQTFPRPHPARFDVNNVRGAGDARPQNRSERPARLRAGVVASLTC